LLVELLLTVWDRVFDNLGEARKLLDLPLPLPLALEALIDLGALVEVLFPDDEVLTVVPTEPLDVLRGFLKE